MSELELPKEHRDILVETLKRQEALLAMPLLDPRFVRWADPAEVEAQRGEYGPHYAASWFGDLPERDRKRYERAVKDLHVRGLLKGSKEYNRLSNVKLTPEGERLARQLLAEAPAATTGGEGQRP